MLAMSRLKNKGLVQPLRARAGFTLLEVMLAVSILSLGLVAVVRSYITSLRALQISQDFLIADLLLEEKIWQKQEENIRRGGVVPEEEQSEFAPPFDNFNYKISFIEQEDLPTLYKSTFTIFWQQGERQQSISYLTYTRSPQE